MQHDSFKHSLDMVAALFVAISWVTINAMLTALCSVLAICWYGVRFYEWRKSKKVMD